MNYCGKCLGNWILIGVEHTAIGDNCVFAGSVSPMIFLIPLTSLKLVSSTSLDGLGDEEIIARLRAEGWNVMETHTFEPGAITMYRMIQGDR